MVIRRPNPDSYREVMRQAVARDFRGGWNTYDTPLNLNSKYITECRNVYSDSNGRIRLRFGTSLLANTEAYLDEIVNMAYYLNKIVAFGKNGHAVTIDGAGTVVEIWSPAIAALLPGAPAGWSTGLTEVNYTLFNGSLVVCNGVDKPIVVNTSMAVSYLQDLGTGSNVNVPIALYCTTHNSYLVLAHTPSDTTTLFIGAKGTLGTFVGDPAPNDAVNFNTYSYVYRGLVDITGLSTFRDRLIVSYNETILSIELGQYNDATPAVHIPRVDDVIDNFGAVSQRCLVPVGDDLLFLDPIGINSIARAQVTGVLSPVRESELVATDIQQAVGAMSLTELQKNTFAVYDRRNNQLMFFVPKETPIDSDTDNNVFVYCFDKSRRYRAMAYYDNMAYRSACRSAESRIFLSRGALVYFYHNEAEPLHMDYSVEGGVTWDDGTTWDDGELWFDAGDGFVGAAIPYAWSTPYSDMQQPAAIKSSKYMMLLAEGAGLVTVDMYTDRFDAAPTLSVAMTQTTDPVSPTLAARPSNNGQVYAWPATFRRARIRVHGSASQALNFISVTLMYNRGSVRQ